MAYKFQFGSATMSGSLTQEGDLTLAGAIANATNISGSGTITGSALNFDQGLINSDGAGGLAADSFGDGTATLQAGALTGVTTIAMGGALSGVTTIAASGLASVASISMDDGSTLGPDSVADLWTFNSDGDTTQKNGTYDFDLASHDGTNGLKLGGVLVNASAADLNFTNVAAAGTAEASKAVVLDASKDIASINDLSASTLSASSDVNVGGTLNCLNSSAMLWGGADFNSQGISAVGAIAGGSTLALSGLASVASISMDDGSTLGPDSVADLITLSAAGDITIKDGAYDFDIASHDGTNGLLLAGVLVNASAADLNFTNVAAAGTAEASKALVLDASKDITGITNLTASYFAGNGSGLTDISSDSVDVADSSANSEFRLVGVAASGDGVALTTMDTAADRITMNALTGKLTVTGDVAANDIAAAGLTLSDLTSGRLPLVSTSGLLADDAQFAWSTDRSELDGYVSLYVSSSASGSVFMGDGMLFVGDGNDDDVFSVNQDGAAFEVALDVASNISGSGNLSSGGTLSVQGNTDLYGTLDVVHGACNFAAATMSGLVTAEAGVVSTTLSGSGNLSSKGALSVQGNTNLYGTLDVVHGACNFAGVTASGVVTIESTLTAASLGSATIDLTADLMIIDDGAAGSIKTTSLANYATAIAGAGLSSTAGALAIDLYDIAGAAVDVANDSIAIVDATDDSTKKEQIADFITAIAGSGLTATAGVLSSDASPTPTNHGDAAGTLVEGLNYTAAVFTAARIWTLPASPDAGDVISVKAPSNAATYNLTVARAGSQTIDGETSLLIESGYGAVDLVYVGSDVWAVK